MYLSGLTPLQKFSDYSAYFRHESRQLKVCGGQLHGGHTVRQHKTVVSLLRNSSCSGRRPEPSPQAPNTAALGHARERIQPHHRDERLSVQLCSSAHDSVIVLLLLSFRLTSASQIIPAW
jgi:hypothetical protein